MGLKLLSAFCFISFWDRIILIKKNQANLTIFFVLDLSALCCYNEIHNTSYLVGEKDLFHTHFWTSKGPTLWYEMPCWHHHLRMRSTISRTNCDTSQQEQEVYVGQTHCLGKMSQLELPQGSASSSWPSFPVGPPQKHQASKHSKPLGDTQPIPKP
jgi:hypothetical protein